MTKAEAEKKFADADRLYREEKFGEALVLLNELDRTFPNDRNIMYPRARCLSKMDRYEEALDLCNQLILMHNHDRAQDLKSRILERDKAGGVGDYGGSPFLESLQLGHPGATPALVPAAPGWPTILIVTAIVLAILAAELLWIF